MAQRLSKILLIRSGEGKPLAYLCALYLVIGLGLALGRSSSDALFFKRFGVEYLPHMFFLTSVLLVIFSTAYAEFADRIRPARMFRVLMLAAAGAIGLIWIAMHWAGARVGFALYFLAYGVLSEIILVHFNLYASSFFDVLQSNRLFPIINASSRLGAVVGGVALGLSAAFWPTEHLALAWGLFLLTALAIVGRRHRGEPKGIAPGKKKRPPFADVREGLRFARRSALLRITGLGVFVMIVLVSIQDYIASTIISRHFADERALAAFFGWFFALTNLIVLVIQLVMTNRMLHAFGLKVVNLVFPWSSVASFGLVALNASLIPAILMRFNYTGMLPAFRNPAANLFYNALPAYMQGRARAMTIGLILPLGLACAGLMLLLVPRSAVGAPLAWVGLVLALLYVFLKRRKNRIYAASLLELIQQQVFAGKPNALEDFGHFSEDTVAHVARMLLETTDVQVAVAYAELLARHAPAAAERLLEEHGATMHVAGHVAILKALAGQSSPRWRELAQQALKLPDARLQVLVSSILYSGPSDGVSREFLRNGLSSDNPRLRAHAAVLCRASCDEALVGEAMRMLQAMVCGGRVEQICALEAMQTVPDAAFRSLSRGALLDSEPQVRAEALRAFVLAGGQADGDVDEAILTAAEDGSEIVREAAAALSPHLTTQAVRLFILRRLLHDQDFSVRQRVEANAAALLPNDEAGIRELATSHFDDFALQRLLAVHLVKLPDAGRRAVSEEIALRHLGAAYAKYAQALAMRECVDEFPDEAGFMMLVLGEEVDRHVELILELLNCVDADGAVSSVQAALRSEDRRLRAQGLESLRHLEHHSSVPGLRKLLETIYDGAPFKYGGASVGGNFSDAVAWCCSHGSTWLRHCAEQMPTAIVAKT